MTNTKIVLIVALVLAIIVLMPWAGIWALNTLFPTLAIPFTFDTWCASVILGGIVSGNNFVTFKK